jgi:hypothetical protein
MRSKVAVFGFMPWHGTGLADSLRHIARAWAELGWPVVFLEVPERPWHVRGPAVERVSHQLVVVRHPALAAPQGLRSLRGISAAVRRMLESVLEDAMYVVHSSFRVLYTVYWLRLWPRRPRVFYWVHENAVTGAFRRWQGAAHREACRTADAVGVVSPRLLPFTPAPALLVRNAVWPSTLAAPVPAPLWDFIFAGHFTHWLDLGALEQLADAAPERRLCLVGPHDGSDRRRFHRLVARPNVTWMGARDMPTVNALIRRSRVGLVIRRPGAINLASDPLKIWDYLANGRPVVAMGVNPGLAGPYCEVVNTADQFVEAALQRCQSPADPERVRDTVRTETWHHRAEQVLSALTARPASARPSGADAASQATPG